ncbi:hypothetical protein COLO4_05101 [Corchorus olitorius]|uniref:DNA-directed RNA polymerase subunit n=1 Tax=Corchorus olitorius TaxID=93759 RepID=A0A1R3KRY5_9ROSI|nr:hypothetical protein COLO4_05101 [Corchorus olitorius]
MFYLSLIEHTLQLPPYLFNRPLDEAITEQLKSLFLDKVIANLGLCISVYDIRSIKGGFVFPGEGSSTYTVEFRLIMFRPFVGEVIVAKLKECDARGLRLSLGFFEDIYVPEVHLPTKSHFECYPNNRHRGRWIWNFGGAAQSEEPQDEEPQFVIDGSDRIKFRVHSVSYPSIPLEQPEDSKPFAPMLIIGTLDSDGLGPVSWWEEAEMLEEES